MKTNVTLEADPFGGARAAFFALLPEETDADWEYWIQTRAPSIDCQVDNFGAFADLCAEALEVCANELSTDAARLISFSCGYFRAMDRVTKAMLDVLPMSAHVPHHFELYRSSLLRFPDRHLETH